MATHNVQVAVIGAGTAGLTATRNALKAGATSIVMIDPGPFGTTCARVGCMPSKLLIAAADAAHDARHARLFGVHAEPTVDGKAVLDRVQRERDRFVGFVLEGVEHHRSAGRLIEARATFTSPTTLALDNGDTVEAERIIIATGSAPFVPPPFRDLGAVALDNASIFELEDLPESLLVVGTGVIGLELGQAMHRLGVRTTIVGIGGALGPLSDPTVLQVAREVFRDELDLHTDYQLHSIQVTDAGARVHFTDSQGNERHETFERVFLAAGRIPTLARLGLGEALDGPIPEVNPLTLQLGELPIFVAGDANGQRPLLHEAADEGRIAGVNAVRYPQVENGHRTTSLGVVFTQPNIAVVGARYADLDPGDFCAGSVDYSRQGRSRVMGQNKGWVRIYGDRDTGRLLGAEMVGPRVEHTAHLLAWAIQQQMTVVDALHMPFYHPVVEEGIRTALRDLHKAQDAAPPRGLPCDYDETRPGI